MVFGFVKQSGGHVTNDSKRGKGTTVNLYFPATASPVAEKKEKGATRPKAEPIVTETILVVEDDRDVLKITVAMLNRLGYKAMEAEDGPSALKILEENDQLRAFAGWCMNDSEVPFEDLHLSFEEPEKQIEVTPTHFNFNQKPHLPLNNEGV